MTVQGKPHRSGDYGDHANDGFLTIDDDETQSYDLTKDDGRCPRRGTGRSLVTLTANPAHDDGSARSDSVQLDAPK